MKETEIEFNTIYNVKPSLQVPLLYNQYFG